MASKSLDSLDNSVANSGQRGFGSCYNCFGRHEIRHVVSTSLMGGT